MLMFFVMLLFVATQPPQWTAYVEGDARTVAHSDGVEMVDRTLKGHVWST